MNINNKLLCILYAAIVVSSCQGPTGPDGRNGNAFVRIVSTDGFLNLYGDNNPAIPSPFQIGQYYNAAVGVYTFAYESRKYTGTSTYTYKRWGGTYSVSINYGTSGRKGKIFWKEGDPGEDGADRYFTLFCNYNGPEESVLGKNNGLQRNDHEQSGSFTIENGAFIVMIDYWLVEKGDKGEQ